MWGSSAKSNPFSCRCFLLHHHSAADAQTLQQWVGNSQLRKTSHRTVRIILRVIYKNCCQTLCASFVSSHKIFLRLTLSTGVLATYSGFYFLNLEEARLHQVNTMTKACLHLWDNKLTQVWLVSQRTHNTFGDASFPIPQGSFFAFITGDAQTALLKAQSTSVVSSTTGHGIPGLLTALDSFTRKAVDAVRKQVPEPGPNFLHVTNLSPVQALSTCRNAEYRNTLCKAKHSLLKLSNSSWGSHLEYPSPPGTFPNGWG